MKNFQTFFERFVFPKPYWLTSHGDLIDISKTTHGEYVMDKLAPSKVSQRVA